MSAALAVPIVAGPAPALAQPAQPPSAPSAAPSAAPTAAPSASPSAEPSAAPRPVPTAAPTAAPVVDEAAVAAAKQKADELRKSARKLFEKGEHAAALAEYQAAFRSFPAWSLRLGAGGCLLKLQRYDEALDVFEGTMAESGPSLPAATKKEVLRQIDTMRTVTGAISITGAEIGAIIVIDGRLRGEHPTAAPLNILVGPHLVRVYKEGYGLFEKSVDVAKGQVMTLPVQLVQLVQSQSGRLKIAESGGKKMEVVVDGVPVGVTPWEGPVAAGEHSVVLRPLPPPEAPPPPEDSTCNAPLPRAQRAIMIGTEEVVATVPMTVVVKPSETAQVQLKAEPLAAFLRVLPDPATARVFVDGIPVGRGGFEGRMKPGDHAVKVEAEGYFTEEQRVTLEVGVQKAVPVALRKDLNAPVWVESGHFTLELTGGVPLTPSFGGELATSCKGDCQQGVGIGGRITLRGGYELGNGFGFGITAGYLQMQQSVTRRAATLLPKDSSKASGIAGVANDTIAMQDFTLGAYGALRLGKRFPVHIGLAAGVALGNITDTRTGLFDASAIGPVSQSGFFPWIFLEPELRVGVRITEHLGLGVSLSGLFLVAPRIPRWNSKMVINPHGNKLGTNDSGRVALGYFDAETVTGSTIFAVTEGLSVRYDF